jgi:UDP-2-acetamido-2-deoxy-ribo-hexuluronate aminotransferase
MTLPIQLVFDTNILVDILLARGHYYKYAVQLLDKVARKEVEGWYAPHSITTVYYLAERSLAVNAENRAQSETKARKLVQSLVRVLKPLPQVGDEILEIVSQPGDDYEDEVIVHLAAEYLPNPLIVTRDKWFLQISKMHSAHPKEIIENGFSSWLPVEHKIDFIDLATQQRELRPQIERNIHRVLAHGQYIMGPEIKQLEERLAKYVGVNHCITVSDGTKALLIAMMALGIKAGDEVITTPFTFIATGEMIALLGAIPVFVDIDPRTYNIDPNKIEAAITSKTKAIMPVSLYGQCADFDAINAIANKHGLPVIEDAAQSFGATYKGKKSCALSTIGSTSFFPSKPLGGYGDGGALFTDDDALAKSMREIRVHGQDRRYHHPIIGINGRMDTLQASIVLAKLDIFDEEVKVRAEIASRYSELINNSEFKTKNPVQGVITPHIESHNTCVYAQYTILVESRDVVQKKLNETGIPTAVHYPITLNLQPAFAYLNKPTGSFPIAENTAKRVMSLPMSPNLTVIDQKRIVEVISEVTFDLV